MSVTNLPFEERLDLVGKIMILTTEDPGVIGQDSPKIATWSLCGHILADTSIYMTSQTSLFKVLRKSDLWIRVLPFLRNGDNRCANKRCGHITYWHDKDTGVCIGYDVRERKPDTVLSDVILPYPSNPNLVKVMCQCKGHIERPFK